MSTDSYIAHVSKDGHRKQSVFNHLENAGRLSYDFGVFLDLPNLCRLVGILHDFGKYSEEFQTYLKSATGLIDSDEDQWVDAGALKGKVDHSTAGARYIHARLNEAKSLKDLMTRDLVGVCIASHHSGLINVCEGQGNYFSRLTKTIPDYIGNVPDAVKDDVETLVPEAIREMDKVFDNTAVR